ncbi:serine/threonine-protein kinase [Streptomyces sp. NPDC049585]|uniref:serine/threonine-protein kinase n=1 Tax=Streptomyces sp. NPDC049585 TaxID=3155154 RepID=UPI0034234BE0
MLLGNRYELSDVRLGGGGFGAVYRGRDTRTGEDVAIKLLDRKVAANPKNVARFVREARALVKVAGTPHVVEARHFGHQVVGGVSVPVLVMELCIGRTLADAIVGGSPVPARLAVDWGRQIAAGLHHTHREGIVHRDIKPSNIMLVGEGTDAAVKVVDFGIACFMSDALTHAPTVVTTHEYPPLTPVYASPEQLDNDDVDGRSDLYSLGCLLQELLTGRRRWRGRRADPLLKATPEPLQELIRQLLAEHPDDRPADALAVYRTLTSVRVTLEPLQSSHDGAAPVRRSRPAAEAAAEMAVVIEAAEADRAYGPLHPEVLALRHGHARLLHNAGERARAARLLAIVAQDRRRVLGPHHPAALDSTRRLAVW